MKLIKSVREMTRTADQIRTDGGKIGVVPTMGYLHEGHLSLVREAKNHADTIVTTVFVNPTQFAPHEDFDKYPRNTDRDFQLAQRAGSDYMFTPSVEEMYPSGYNTFVEVGKITGILEGKFRPTHFRGVATIVTKLFNVIRPHVAIFGQKDAQQAAVIKRMVRDLNYDIKILIGPTIRETDGLAMSSRNVYLSPEQRKESACIYESLKKAEKMIAEGERDSKRIITEVTKFLANQPSLKIEYVSIADPESMEECSALCENSHVLISLAVRIGETRLIDNVVVEL